MRAFSDWQESARRLSWWSGDPNSEDPESALARASLRQESLDAFRAAGDSLERAHFELKLVGSDRIQQRAMTGRLLYMEGTTYTWKEDRGASYADWWEENRHALGQYEERFIEALRRDLALEDPASPRGPWKVARDWFSRLRRRRWWKRHQREIDADE